MKKLLSIFLASVLLPVVNLRAQTTNIDFESTPPAVYSASNAVNGWTISSRTNTSSCSTSTVWTPGSPEFSIISTPILNFPTIGSISHSPLGGANIARLNNSTPNASSTKLSQTFSVTPSNSALQFAFAGLWQSGAHTCCDQPFMMLQIKDSQGIALNCYSYSFTPPGAGCMNGATGFSVTGSEVWTNWQVKFVNLAGFTGSIITLEVITSDCSAGDHYGTLFVDAKALNGSFPFPINPQTVPNPVNWCPGSGVAQINAPYGYTSYQWYAPGGNPITSPTGTLPSLSVLNPIAGQVYTVLVISTGGCTSSMAYTLATTQVSIVALGAGPSCSMGASGSATVIGGGSGGGYTYIWKNAANMTVGTSSIASGLSPGIYSVQVSALASPGCGTSNATVQVATAAQGVINQFKPYCGNEAFINSGGGSNFQWYNGTVAIPAVQGGTSPSITISSPINGSTYHLSYLSPFGCKDSIAYFIASMSPGTLTVPSLTTCVNATNVNATISLVPAPGSPSGQNYFYVSSTGTTAPYSASLNPTSLSLFGINGLAAGGTYSVQAFDGSCKYTKSFSITPLVFDYTVAPVSATVCSGGSVAGSIKFSSLALLSQYTYAWSPTSGIFGPTNPNVIIQTVTVSPGSSLTTIYTVVVTPTALNCPLTKTLSITTANPVTPTIGLIPALCSNAPAYTISANPPGGTFSHPAVSPGGVLIPSLAVIGTNTVIYANSIGACSATGSAIFVIQGPVMSVTSSHSIFCGQTATLTASGADTYLWSNTLTSPSITVAPLSTQIYSVTGTNTTNLCSKTHTVQITVTSTFVISTAGEFPACSGNPLVLYASGANTYTWSNATTGFSTTVNPQPNTTYSVTGMDLFGCQSYTTILVKDVYLTPTVTIYGNLMACAGETTTLTAVGAYSYSLNNTPVDFKFPVGPGTYTLTGSSFEGCKEIKIIKVNDLGCVGLEADLHDIKLRVYPNPTNGKVYIETPGQVHISVLDYLGKVILEKSIDKNTATIDLTSYPNGVYILKTAVGRETKITKLVKNN